MKPLAYRLRPKSFDDVVGQDHLVGKDGVIRKMLQEKKLFSMILYGAPGTGKTTIASIIAEQFPFNHYFFNASTDSKQKLKEIADDSKLRESTIVIIDEIHRMKSDVQDFLLPFIESGAFIMIGLTASNPYHSINIAIRSRCHIFQLKPVLENDVKLLLKRALKSDEIEKDVIFDDDVLDYIVSSSNNEIRTALNMLEVLVFSLSDGERMRLPKAENILLKPSRSVDKNGDNYYDTISALQKSIRGSDVNASLHYLARLLSSDDFEILARRLLVISYEDIGLANPGIGPKCVAAIEAFRELGMPEGRIPLACLVVDMALSPKSNSAYLSIDKAIDDYNKKNTGQIPDHLKNGLINSGKATYKYPHDYQGAYVTQDYLPDAIRDANYYIPKETGSYERALKERYEIIKKLKGGK